MPFKSILPRLFRPEVYQGKRKPARYFEGWYNKLVDHAGEQVWSFIPGVSYAEENHAFIQVIHANSGKTWYQKYPENDFKSSRKVFQTDLGPNHFSLKEMKLDLTFSDLKVKGELFLKNPQPFPVSFLSPGIMGWYSYAPKMECYHGVVSMQHGLSGSLEINVAALNFDKGTGYIEKDWGSSMPSDWIWIQSNHFDTDPGASFMLSLARIPWMKGFFPGFLSFLVVKGRLYRFATYKRSKVDHIEVKDDVVNIQLRNPKNVLHINVYRNIAGTLKAPRHGNMDREIQESVVSSLDLVLLDHQGKVIFRGTGIHAGLEIVGDVAKYFRNIH